MPDYTVDENRTTEPPEVSGVQHQYVSVGGCRLHVATAGDVAAAPVILLHGFPQHWYVWRDVMVSLAQTRRVIALDLRGFGWSDAPRGGYSTADRVSDVLAVLDALGIGSADVVGHDWGAWLGFRLALDHPDRLRRLVSISMVHPWVMQRHLLPNVWRWWVTTLFELPGAGEWMLRARPKVTGWLMARDAVRPAVWTSGLRARYATPAAEPARAQAGRRLHTQLVLHDIPRLLLGKDRRRVLTVPTLIVGGDHDALLPPRVLTAPGRFADSIAVRTIHGGHYVVDENPDQVLALVRDHLR